MISKYVKLTELQMERQLETDLVLRQLFTSFLNLTHSRNNAKMAAVVFCTTGRLTDFSTRQLGFYGSWSHTGAIINHRVVQQRAKTSCTQQQDGIALMLREKNPKIRWLGRHDHRTADVIIEQGLCLMQTWRGFGG